MHWIIRIFRGLVAFVIGLILAALLVYASPHIIALRTAVMDWIRSAAVQK